MNNKIINAALTLVVSLLLMSCSMRDINGDFDGQWQIQKIEWADGQSQTIGDQYMCIQQHMVQLTPGGRVSTGVLDYDKDDKVATMTFPYAKDGDLKKWGILGTSVTFNIQKLSREHCVLVSADATITMRKW